MGDLSHYADSTLYSDLDWSLILGSGYESTVEP